MLRSPTPGGAGPRPEWGPPLARSGPDRPLPHPRRLPAVIGPGFRHPRRRKEGPAGPCPVSWDFGTVVAYHDGGEGSRCGVRWGRGGVVGPKDTPGSGPDPPSASRSRPVRPGSLRHGGVVALLVIPLVLPSCNWLVYHGAPDGSGVDPRARRSPRPTGPGSRPNWEATCSESPWSTGVGCWWPPRPTPWPPSPPPTDRCSGRPPWPPRYRPGTSPAETSVPTVGITSTPVIDDSRQEIFVVADQLVGPACPAPPVRPERLDRGRLAGPAASTLRGPTRRPSSNGWP